jgi:hypothetical protein
MSLKVPCQSWSSRMGEPQQFEMSASIRWGQARTTTNGWFRCGHLRDDYMQTWRDASHLCVLRLPNTTRPGPPPIKSRNASSIEKTSHTG